MPRPIALLFPLLLLSTQLACGDKDAGDEDDDGTVDSGGADGGSSETGDLDADNDGYSPNQGDCDDTDPDRYPGADEVCNGIDDDCDNYIDEDSDDTDGDGTADCMDEEECDGLDNDGDGEIDEDLGDSDEDGVPDCYDEEECDGLDNDGDGDVDEDFDMDGDGSSLCDPVPDCDDTDANRSPDLVELAGDGIDNDCNGLIDEGEWAFGDLIIVELMVNPAAVSDPSGEWFELYNNTDDTLYLNGLELVSSGDVGHVVDHASPIALASGESAVLALNASASVNGGVTAQYDYNDIALLNEDDDLSVYADGVLIDTVTWGPDVGLPAPNGATLMLDVIYFSATDNDDIGSWCPATSQWASGSDYGTPGDPDQYCSIIDHDGDGYWVDDGDCDDGDPTVYPGAEDTWYDGIDSDCDGWSDYDADYDGYDYDLYGGDDCDDTTSAINPSRREVCDEEGLDEDCDGLINSEDDSAAGAVNYYPDEDEDGYGDDSAAVESCDPVDGYTTTRGDCDDSDDSVYPGAPDTWYDGVDSDCEGDSDYDADGDGFDTDTVGGGDDCDDTDPDINPDGREVCDDEGADEDCNGLANSEDPGVTESITYYLDGDDDGYGVDDDTVEGCDPIDGYADEGGDCDDDDADVNPGQTENWYDGVDADCDGWNDYDADRDGFALEDYGGIDCDDEDNTVWPYAWEDDTDGVDNDCDGYVDTEDPDEPTELSLSDDDYEYVALEGMTFDFCGTEQDDLYVSSNGLITFTYASTSYSESGSSFRSFGYPLIGMWWDDMNPGYAGDMYVLEHDGAFALYVRGVPEYYSEGSHTWTTVLMEEGHLFTAYDEMTSATDGVIGWSCGTGGSDYSELDLTAALEDVHEGAFGIGDGTEDSVYEVFTTSQDIEYRTILYCGTAGDDADSDGYTDLCGDSDDGDSSVHP